MYNFFDFLFRSLVVLVGVILVMKLITWVTFGGPEKLKKELRMKAQRKQRLRDFQNHHPGIRLRH